MGFKGRAFETRDTSNLYDAISSGPGRGRVVKIGDDTDPVTLDSIRAAYQQFISKLDKSSRQPSACCIILEFTAKTSGGDLSVELGPGKWYQISEIFEIFTKVSSKYCLSIFIASKGSNFTTKHLMNSTSNNEIKSHNLLPDGCTVVTIAYEYFDYRDVVRWLDAIRLDPKWKQGVSILDLLNLYLVNNRFIKDYQMQPWLSIFGGDRVRQYYVHEVFTKHLGTVVRPKVVTGMNKRYGSTKRDVLIGAAGEIESATDEHDVKLERFPRALALTLNERLLSDRWLSERWLSEFAYN
ncbi:hypothetical protein CJF31_00010239 [Rutstroemia sp. NJR-2017a BVV2]|nr:hypothetical protein CJF31_00010239 [Rutstroemia sp. NJR-2017a BVV2]